MVARDDGGMATQMLAQARVARMADDPEYVLQRVVRGYRPNRLTRELSAVLRDGLRLARSGEPWRATLSAPPRHGKSVTVGIASTISAACAASLAREPWPILYATSSGDRASDISRSVRSLVERIHRATGDDWWQPGEKWTALEWETRGGLGWKALGWTAGSGGIGARQLVMDDLLGSSVAYQSEATLNRMYHVIEEDLMSRLMGAGTIAIQMETRRGERDATGYLTEHYGDVFTPHVWPCWTEERGYLWPEVYGERWRSGMPHLTDSSPIWRSLYQQEPVPDGGLILDPSWLDARYAHIPVPEAARSYDRVVVGVDLASTGRTRADDCAIVVIGCHGARRDVLHVTSEQMSYVRVRQRLQELCEEWGATCVVVERAANGDALVDDLGTVIRGIRGESATRDKVARLTPWLPMLAAGQVRWPSVAVPWRSRALDQLRGFTGEDGAPDDIVDALVWALVAGSTGRYDVPDLGEDIAAALSGLG